MSATATDPAPLPADPPAAPSAGSGVRRPWRAHLLMAVAALALAVYVTQHLWSDPYRHVIAANAGDQAFFEWLLGYGVYLLGNGGDPFFTDLLNTPAGVNLAANTSITVYIVLFSPLTHLLGPQISFVTILTLNLAGAAFAWYLFFRRYVTTRAVAAGVAGLFCGFAPGFISHANGHLNWSAGWVAPVVLWWVLKLREPGRWLRNGLVLGVLVTIGFSIAAEGLFFTALAAGLFLGTWTLASAPTRAEARAALPTVLRGLGVTALVAGALLAYPLYMHFAGPQSFSGTGFSQRHFVEDVAAYVAYADRSLATLAGLNSGDLAPNPTEQTSFFGSPLLLLVGAGLMRMWGEADRGRRATLLALAVTAVVFAVLSWGPRLQFLEHETNVVLPYAALTHLPLFDSALPGRFALVLVGVFGVLLAMIGDRLLTKPYLSSGVRTAYAAGFVLALVPIFPLPLVTGVRSAEPAFISTGTWQRYVSEDGVLSSLPLPTNTSPDGQRWQAYTMARGGPQFRIPNGYFLGPGGKDGTGQIGPAWHQTDWMFIRAALEGYVPPITDFERAQARADFAYWKIEAVFLAPQITGEHGVQFRNAVEMTAIGLLGQPERVDDVLVWRIRPGVDPVTSGR
ncbi:DUF2079 domain-containing protein [Jidongwangia harbinensis]|uniref:DUF2079 domain-containing protein n=1 Tax=Jidongwangia harbinensis TaxID=2878561 RepID=UPI001CD97D0B|nr:DUF2079 domain-containing protein [Jidongwangia harbinensis]MCA2212519.1 DUF2079 domain-containing protein [Jidongwangia harbinensis]